MLNQSLSLQNTSMEETEYLARPFYREVPMGGSVEFEDDILLYDKKGSVPIWYDENKGMQGAFALKKSSLMKILMGR